MKSLPITIALSLSLSLLYMGCGSKLGGGNPLGEIGGGIEDGADFGEGALPDGIGDVLKKGKNEKKDEVVPVGCPDNDADAVCNDVDNCVDVSNPDQNNNDGDAFGDACDDNDDNDLFTDVEEAEMGTDPFADTPDFDGDGTPDVLDPCPVNPDPACAAPAVEDVDPNDTDNDSVPNATDNCPDTANPGQTNSDADAFGDACDICPAVANPAQNATDANTNGTPDECEPAAPEEEETNWCDVPANSSTGQCTIYDLCVAGAFDEDAEDTPDCSCLISEVEDNQDPASCLEEEGAAPSPGPGCSNFTGAKKAACLNALKKKMLMKLKKIKKVKKPGHPGGPHHPGNPGWCPKCGPSAPTKKIKDAINPKVKTKIKKDALIDKKKKTTDPKVKKTKKDPKKKATKKKPSKKKTKKQPKAHP